MSETKVRVLVPSDEEQKVSRSLLLWLNTYPDLPTRVDFESLPDDAVGLALSTIQAAYKLQQYIDGGYTAQYQFKIVYRVQPSDNNSRLAADELLNAIGTWAERRENRPAIDGVLVERVQRDSNAALYAAYEDGSQDHQILMSLIYEVN